MVKEKVRLFCDRLKQAKAEAEAAVTASYYPVQRVPGWEPDYSAVVHGLEQVRDDLDSLAVRRDHPASHAQPEFYSKEVDKVLVRSGYEPESLNE